MDHAEAYHKQLSSFHLGIPLWTPSPTLDGRQIRLGDVGYYEPVDGCFEVLFNCTKDQDHQWNRRFGVPGYLHDGERLSIATNDVRGVDKFHFPNNKIHRVNIKSRRIEGDIGSGPVGAGLEFETSNRGGAIAVVFPHARIFTAIPRRKLRKYVRSHIDEWHKFAKDLGRDVQRSDLVMVSRIVNTVQWVNAAWNAESIGGTFRITAEGLSPAQGSFSVGGSDESQSGVLGSQGGAPPRAPPAELVDDDFTQTLFLTGFRMAWGGFPVVLKASAEPLPMIRDNRNLDSEPITTEDEDYASDWSEEHIFNPDSLSAYIDMVEQTSEPFKVIDPLEILLQYMLETPGAQRAVADHQDLREVCQGEHPDDLLTFLRDRKPEIEVDSDNVAMLSYPDEFDSSTSSILVAGAVQSQSPSSIPADTTAHPGNFGLKHSSSMPVSTTLSLSAGVKLGPAIGENATTKYPSRTLVNRIREELCNTDTPTTEFERQKHALIIQRLEQCLTSRKRLSFNLTLEFAQNSFDNFTDIVGQNCQETRFVQAAVTLQGTAAVEMLDILREMTNMARFLALRSSILELMRQLAASSGTLPTSFLLTDVEIDNRPVARTESYTTYRGRFAGLQVAIKRPSTNGEDEPVTGPPRFYRDAIIWSTLEHPNLVGFLGAHKANSEEYGLDGVFPWMENGKIHEYLYREYVENLQIIGNRREVMLSDVAAGVAYLHSQGVAHGDISSDNILVDGTGCAVVALWDPWVPELGRSGVWTAPELLETSRRHRAPESDMYSFGCLIYDLFVVDGKRTLNPTNLKRPSTIQDPYYGRGIPDALWKLAKACLSSHPDKRPKARAFLDPDDLSSPVDAQMSKLRTLLRGEAFDGQVLKYVTVIKRAANTLQPVLHDMGTDEFQQFVRDFNETRRGLYSAGRGSTDGPRPWFAISHANKTLQVIRPSEELFQKAMDTSSESREIAKTIRGPSPTLQLSGPTPNPDVSPPLSLLSAATKEEEAPPSVLVVPRHEEPVIPDSVAIEENGSSVNEDPTTTSRPTTPTDSIFDAASQASSATTARSDQQAPPDLADSDKNVLTWLNATGPVKPLMADLNVEYGSNVDKGDGEAVTVPPAADADKMAKIGLRLGPMSGFEADMDLGATAFLLHLSDREDSE